MACDIDNLESLSDLQTPPTNNASSKNTVQHQMQDLKRKYAELELKEKRMIENLEAMMEEADETKAGSSVKNEDIIGKDLTLEIDTSGLVWPFFCHVCPTLEMLRPSILLALQVPRHTHEPLDETLFSGRGRGRHSRHSGAAGAHRVGQSKQTHSKP